MLNNEEFTKILNNQNNIKIAKSVAKLFTILDKDDVDSEIMVCLWKTASNFDPNRNVKFTTYFREILFWKLMQLTRKKLKEKKMFINKTLECGKVNDTTFYDVLSDIPKKYSKVLVQKYLEKKSLKEIGQENGYSYEYARVQIKQAIEYIRNGV